MRSTRRLKSYHEELAEGDVWEDIVSFVLAAGQARLFPEVGELLQQRSTRSQVQHILSGQGIIQERVVQVGKEPGGVGTVTSSRGQ